MKKFMELELPIVINNQIKNSKKIIKVLGFSVLGLTFVVTIGLVTTISIRTSNEEKMKDYVFNLMTTDMTAFVNPNKIEFKKLKETEVIKKLVENSEISLEDYEALLTKYLIESNDINLDISEKIFKIYKLKLLEHASITINEFNNWEKINCNGVIGCNNEIRYEARTNLQEGLKEKLKEKEDIFLETISKILSKDEEIPEKNTKKSTGSVIEEKAKVKRITA